MILLCRDNTPVGFHLNYILLYRDYYLFVLSRDILLYRPVICSSLISIAIHPTDYSFSEVGTNAMGFCSPVVGVVDVVRGRGVGAALGLTVAVYCQVVLLALLVFARSFRSTSIKVREAAIVRCLGAGYRCVGLVGVACLPLDLDCSALAEVSSSMASTMQV